MNLATNPSRDDAWRAHDSRLVTSIVLWALLIVWVIVNWAFYFAMPAVNQWGAMQAKLEYHEQVLSELRGQLRQRAAAPECPGTPQQAR